MAAPEVWLRGPLPDISRTLQPVAHSLLQCREEVESTLAALAPEVVWRPVGTAAPIGFHIRHAIGSLDRLLTYARGEALSRDQLEALRAESNSAIDVPAAVLAGEFRAAVDRALAQLRTTPEPTLFEPRLVGSARLPSTVIGLLFHAAEHTQRHVGQMITTSKAATPAR